MFSSTLRMYSKLIFRYIRLDRDNKETLFDLAMQVAVLLLPLVNANPPKLDPTFKIEPGSNRGMPSNSFEKYRKLLG